MSGFSSLESFLLAFVLGEAALALILLIAGSFGGFRPAFFWGVFALLFYGAAREIAKLRVKTPEKATPLEFICWLLIALGLGRALVATCAPPSDWDSAAYHLAYAKLFLREGRIVELPGSFVVPFNSEALYAFAMALRGELACHWINFMNGAMLLLAVFALARKFFSGEAGLLAVALLAVQPVFQRVMGNGLTDASVALPALLAVLTLPWPALSGVLAGVAISNKLTGLWMAAALALLIAFRRDWKGLGYFVLAAAIAGSPWVIKNWISYGNPVWPHWPILFGGSGAELEAWNRWRGSVTEGVPKTFMNLLMLPLSLVIKPEAFTLQPQFLAGPFLLLLSARAALHEEWSREEKTLALLVALLAFIWFWVFQSWRYLLPAAAIISVLIASWALRQRERRFVWLALFFALVPAKDLSVATQAFGASGLRSKSAPDLSARDRYLQLTVGPYYKLCRLSNEVLPAEAKVLLYKDVRGYYLDREYAWGDALNRGVLPYAEIADGKELARKLRALGFTHVLLNPELMDPKGDAAYYARANGLMKEALREAARPVLTVEGTQMALFELSP